MNALADSLMQTFRGPVRTFVSSSEISISALRGMLEPRGVDISLNPNDLKSHGKGESFHPVAPPSAVVTPSSIQDVVEIVKHCGKYKLPIIPFGAGTSVEGHVCAIRGGISLDMRLFDAVEIHESENGMPEPMAKVGAGVTRKRLNEQLRCALWVSPRSCGALNIFFSFV
mmetsp:Transcript_3354/g.7479  ORF Transcript_3354/g.7479 Transcript_3354/m.7479 type:complete len:170 (+) Transcript_3354:38-547(+)